MTAQCIHRVSRTTAGFSLIEVLIAMAMMGMVLAALAAITRQWLPNWNRGFVRIQRSEQVALAIERIAADIGAAEFIPAARGATGPFFEGTDRSIKFVRTSLGPNSQPGLEIVRLAESPTENGPALVRMRTPFVPVNVAARNGAALTFADPVILLRSPYQLSFSYAGVDRIWREAWQLQTSLPTAIKLTVRDDATRQTLSLSTAVVIRGGLPAECAAAKSYDECLQSYQKALSGTKEASRAIKGGETQ